MTSRRDRSSDRETVEPTHRPWLRLTDEDALAKVRRETGMLGWNVNARQGRCVSLRDRPTRVNAVKDREVLLMRIGFDMFAVQSPHHGHRGIGRYSANLVSTLLKRDDDHEYILYVYDALPAKRVPSSTRARIRNIPVDGEAGTNLPAYLDKLVQTNPDDLDAFVVLSAFEKWGHYTPPSHPKNGLKMFAVVYDLIPFLFQNEWEPDPLLRRHYRVLEQLSRYDALLAISEATRKDILALLKLPPDKVVNISAASDPTFFFPDRDPTLPPASKKCLDALGIQKPYVLNVGGIDDRKNLPKLIEAFSALPPKLRREYQLVITCKLWEYGLHWLKSLIAKFDVEGSVILTDEVSDETLRLLYQRCAAFAFPSAYEGFGLPLLEAMHCGAAVVAGNNSSQIEVVGDAGLLIDAGDAIELKTRMEEILDNPLLAQKLGEKAISQAETFHWERTASLALMTLSPLETNTRSTRRVRFDQGHGRKPTIAFLSPLPPRKSGVSDYSALLLEELRKTYKIDLFHDTGYVPEPALSCDEFMTCDYRLFERFAAVKNYHAIVYQMGNSPYHDFMYSILQRHRGVVTLHDFCLAGFHLNYGRRKGLGNSFLRAELMKWYPECRGDVLRMLDGAGRDNERIVRACATNGWFLNLQILESAQATIFHSPWCETQVRTRSPLYADRTVVIPFGVIPRHVHAMERIALRDRFSIPQDALVLSAFGFVHPGKLCLEAIEAYAPIARENENAMFLFVGEEADGGITRRHAAELGLADRVRFLGRQPMDAFDALMNVTDLGINLRMPPTNGETSAALLNLLASGVATIITDVDTFSDFSSTIVRKVRWDTDGLDGLKSAFHELACDRPRREALGRAAWAYVDEYHDWSRVARLYVEAIERCHDELAVSRPGLGYASPHSQIGRSVFPVAKAR